MILRRMKISRTNENTSPDVRNEISIDKYKSTIKPYEATQSTSKVLEETHDIAKVQNSARSFEPTLSPTQTSVSTLDQSAKHRHVAKYIADDNYENERDKNRNTKWTHTLLSKLSAIYNEERNSGKGIAKRLKSRWDSAEPNHQGLSSQTLMNYAQRFSSRNLQASSSDQNLLPVDFSERQRVATPYPAASSCIMDTTNGLQSLFISRKRILKRVPKASRLQAAFALAGAFEQVVIANDVKSWTHLFCFSQKCLSQPKRSGKKSPSLATIVKKQTNEYMSGGYQMISDSNPSMQHKLKQTNLATIVANKIADFDIKGALRILTSDDSVAPSDECNTMTMISKHPPAHAASSLPVPPELPINVPIIISSDMVKHAVMGFHCSSAGGPDGLRPQHMKDLLHDKSGAAAVRLLEAVTKFVNFAVGGQINSLILPYFCGARLLALKKNDGGIRPIAIGCTLRRLVAKVCSHSIRDQAAKFLQPNQLGFGAPLGCEACVHATRAYSNAFDGSNKVILKVDYKNAFNAIRRDLVLTAVSRNFPQLFPFAWQCYSECSYLIFGSQIISSSEGVQQGDPLGPFLFSLAINETIKSLSSEFNSWYLDDGILAGNPITVLNDLKFLLAQEDNLGLQINPAKCELFILCSDDNTRQLNINAFRSIAPEITLKESTHLQLLGSPIGHSARVKVLDDKVIALQSMHDKIKHIDAHDAFFLLKNCLSFPKVLYVLRSSPCYGSVQLTAIDNLLRRILCDIINVDINEGAWSQAQLPVQMGGLGIRSVEQLSVPAYLASAFGSASLMGSILRNCEISNDGRYETATALWQTESGVDEVPVKAGCQNEWDTPVCKQRLTQILLSTTDQLTRARLLAVSDKSSGHWLSATPIQSLGLKLNDDHLRIAIGLRLGCRLSQPYACICGSICDTYGYHSLTCKKSMGRLVRHKQANDLIQRALNSAGCPSILEPLGVSRNDGKRPDGMSLVPWSHGRSLCWDFTCCSTLASSNLEFSIQGAAKMAEKAEKLKATKYSNLNDSLIFVPICIETLGTFGPSASTFLSNIGKRLIASTGDIRSASYLHQSISMAVQRGNAISVLGTLPKNKTLKEIYYL